MSEVHSKCPIVLLLGNTLRFTDATFTLTSGADGVRCHVAFEDDDLGPGAELDLCSGPGGKSGHLRAQGLVATLFDDVELVERTFPSGDDEYAFLGLQADFSFPHHGPFRRLRTVFVGLQDDEVAEALIESWGADEADNVTHLPWTLESLTRFAAAHARGLPHVAEVVAAGQGQLTLRFEAGASHHVNLNNLLARVRGEPEAATEAITAFFAATTPSAAEVENGNVMFRVMHAPHPVTIQVEVGGETRALELASAAVGPDLSAVFVRDSPRNIAYLQPGEVAGLGLDADGLLGLGCENLVRTLPRIHIRGENDRYMIIAGGDYECSLALVPELWQAIAPLLSGAPVIAMPSRDLCFITVDEPEAIAGLRSQIDSLDDLAYPVSSGIYRVTKQGRWFEPVG